MNPPPTYQELLNALRLIYILITVEGDNTNLETIMKLLNKTLKLSK